MKLLQEALLVFGIYFFSEILVKVTHFPIPANLVGMMLLFLFLCTKKIQVQQIETISNFLLKHMAFFFIPAGVNLISSFHMISNVWIQLIVFCILTTIITMAVTGICVQKFMDWRDK